MRRCCSGHAVSLRLRQRKQLETLQAELQASVEFRHDDELQLQSARENQSDAMGSDAQHIALEANNRAIGAHTQMRLDAVRRALAKIEDGSYGGRTRVASRSRVSGSRRGRARALQVALGAFTDKLPDATLERYSVHVHPERDGSSSNRAWHRTRSRPSAAAPAPVPSSTSG